MKWLIFAVLLCAPLSLMALEPCTAQEWNPTVYYSSGDHVYFKGWSTAYGSVVFGEFQAGESPVPGVPPTNGSWVYLAQTLPPIPWWLGEVQAALGALWFLCGILTAHAFLRLVRP